MIRNIIFDLIHWKDSSDRKPMLLMGARHVGKTWIMKEFARTCYDNSIYLDFEENPELGTIFARSKEPHRIIELLSLMNNVHIEPGKTLVIFDEIQNCPDALNSLKYFHENANDYHVIAAFSYRGSKSHSYPVCMVNILKMYPMCFDEFLCALDSNLYEYYMSIVKDQIIPDVFHNRLTDAYNYYQIVGGMPDCVSSWIRYRDPVKVSRIQQDLIELYENDFAKHNGNINSGRILMVFRSIVSQLAKPNEKFMYQAVRNGARAREFEEAIEWLVSAGLVNRVHNVAKMEHPLAAYDKLNQFKLFLFDTGLLKHMSGVDDSAIILKADYQFKGQLAENYILQQLNGQFMMEPRYYSDGYSEIDFVIQNGMDIIPVEVKGGEDRSANSFKRYVALRHPVHAIRFSLRGYRKDGDFTNIPLYLAPRMKDLL